MPVSRHGTLSRLRSTPRSPLAPISTAEQVRPAAPMSWIAITQSLAMISRHASSSSFSENGSPTCTVGRFSSASAPNSAEAMVAPWMPSRPVFEPREPVGDVDHAGVLARPLDHPRRLGGQRAQVDFGGLVGAMLIPHGRKDAELGKTWRAANQLEDTLVFVRPQPVGSDQVGGDLRDR